MSGIYAGGKYMPGCSKVALFAVVFNKKWYYAHRNFDRRIHLDVNVDKITVDGMYHCAPEPLAFWSNQDASIE